MRKIASLIFSRLFLTGLIIVIQLAVFITIWLRLVEYSLLSGSLMMLLSLLIVIYISSKNEPSAYKIGWIILIMLFPVLGGMMYLIFGNKRPVRKKKARLSRYRDEYKKYMKPDKDLEAHIKKTDSRFGGTMNYLQEEVGFPASSGGSIDYYPLGDDAFPAMLRDLEKAEKFIFMEYFIIARGEMWDSIYEILKKKAQSGVDVRLIYDDVGSLSTVEANFHKKMEAVGIKCFSFNNFVPLLSIAMNHRDHRKITVIDGKVAFTGGYNLADEYINAIEKYGHWKDTGLRIRGRAVQNFTVMFWKCGMPSAMKMRI